MEGNTSVDKAKLDRLRNMMKASVGMADVKQAQAEPAPAAEAQPQLEVVATSIQKVDAQDPAAQALANVGLPDAAALQKAGEAVLDAVANALAPGEVVKEVITTNPPAAEAAQEAPAKPARKSRAKPQAKPQEVTASTEAPAVAPGPTPAQQATLEQAYQAGQQAAQAAEHPVATVNVQATCSVVAGGEGSRFARLATLANQLQKLQPRLDPIGMKQLDATGVLPTVGGALIEIDTALINLEVRVAQLTRIVEGNQPTQGAQ